MDNNNDEILTTLTDYGLDKREASLYLAGLEIGETSMSILAKKAGIKRPTAYLTFKSLERMGLMGSIKMRSGMKFIATKPEALIARGKAKIKNLESIMPNIQAIMGGGTYKPRVTYYEGKEALLSVVEECLKKPNSIMRHIGSLKELHRVISEDYDFNYFIPKRIKQNIHAKALYFPDLSEKIIQRDGSKELREIRPLPLKYNNNVSTVILEDKIIIFGGSKELITVMIESKEIAFSEQQKFDLIWDLVGEGKYTNQESPEHHFS